MDHMPIGHASIDRRILAHRRDDDAVGKLELADAERREQHAHVNLLVRRSRVLSVSRARPKLSLPIEARRCTLRSRISNGRSRMFKQMRRIASALVLALAIPAAAEAKTYYWISHGSPADPVWTY